MANYKLYHVHITTYSKHRLSTYMDWKRLIPLYGDDVTSLFHPSCAPFLNIIFTILIIFSNDNKYSQPKYIETRKTRGLKQQS